MTDHQEEHLCQSVYDAITNAQKRCQLLEGRDRYALQSELLEWIFEDWKGGDGGRDH